ncbi:MAG: ABC transporter ATP-binding protein [Candidatus Dormibacteraeota bacterium]|nr:ABC transporter ATP-binding protein [Candidatus Dormibacteraeota bacterium]
MTTVVELSGVHKRFGAVEALAGIDLAIEQGEVLAMLGPNGAGKTTAIAIMLGMRQPTAGSARLFGLDPVDRRARSSCGVMLQESGLNDALLVIELVQLFRAYYPQPMSVARALELAGLQEQAQMQASKLSGGQRQRLYYALAVCGDPDVVFLDEPTVGMDVESRRTFLQSIGEFADQGKTIILTTHYLDEADELAHRIVVVDRGKVVADAPPAQIKSRVGGKRVSFASDRILKDGDLEGLPITSWESNGARTRILTHEPEAVLRALFTRSLEIRDLEVGGADLEEAFLALTSHTGAGRTEAEVAP